MDPQRYIWIDEFIANVRPYVMVRKEDGVLIKKPNMAQKLNPTGAMILHDLLGGMRIEEMISRRKLDDKKLSEIICFVHAVKATLGGKLNPYTSNPAVEKKAFHAPFSELPVLSELAITSRCNLRCAFCYAGINCTAAPGPDLSLRHVKRLLGVIRNDAKVPSVSLTGGEPTLREDIFRIIRYAKRLDMRVNLISNGTLIDKSFAKKLKSSGLDTAQISIEGSRAEVHDKITGVNGSFEKAISAMGFLREQGIPVHGNTTLSAENKEDVKHLPLMYREMGFDRFSMNLVIPVGSVMKNRELGMTYSQAATVIDIVNKESVRQGIEFMWYSPVPLKIYNTITEGLGNKGCAACDGLLSVDSSGNLLPCSSWNEPVGNLLRESFKDVWNSKRSVFIRHKKEAPKECEGCEHFQVCQGACPLFWRQMPLTELKQYCLKEKYETCI